MLNIFSNIDTTEFNCLSAAEEAMVVRSVKRSHSNENTSYSAMLNIAEPVPPPESVPPNSGIAAIHSTPNSFQFRNGRNSVTIEFLLIPEFRVIPSNSGIAIPSLIMYHHPHPQLTQFHYGIPGIESKRNWTEFLELLGIGRNWFLEFRNCVESDKRNSGN